MENPLRVLRKKSVQQQRERRKLKKRIWSALENGNHEELLRILELLPFSIDGSLLNEIFANHQGWTLVHECVHRGHAGKILATCAALGDVNAEKRNGLRPVDVAAAKGDLPMLLALERLGANVKLRRCGDLNDRCAKLEAECSKLRRNFSSVNDHRVRELCHMAKLRDERDVATSRSQDLERQAAVNARDLALLNELRENPLLKQLIGSSAASNLCCICQDRPANTQFRNCNHIVCCELCADRHLKLAHPQGVSQHQDLELMVRSGWSQVPPLPAFCPMCREPIISSARVPGFP